MSDFHTFETRKAAKEHRCEHCRKSISKGEAHRRVAQVWEGDFHCYREHLDCFAAWSELNFSRDLRDLGYDEGAPFLADDEHEEGDRDWMREKYPVVAERLGWAAHKPSSLPTTTGKEAIA